MASVEVFIDDAVRGNLPYLCAKTGRPADGVQRIEQKVGGNPWLALLILFPGLGWLVLLVALLLSSGRSTLSVRLPMSREALAKERRYRMQWWGGLAVAALLGLAGFKHVLGLPMRFWVVLAVAAVLIGLAGYLAMCQAIVRVRLDASHRWVTLSGVAPAFRDAVNARQRAESEHRPA